MTDMTPTHSSEEQSSLLPCPFCGEVPTTIEADANQGYKWGRVRCCIEGPEVRTGYETSDNAPWHANAIAAWNTRADATSALRGADEARQFPGNTCPASRHAQMIGEALVKGEVFPQLSEEPAHCGQSILATVEALYRARTALRGAQKESGWRPIETAPKDGSEFVARGFNYNDPAKGRHHEIAHWDGVAFGATPDGMSIVLDYLTDWAPLPTDSTPIPGEAK